MVFRNPSALGAVRELMAWRAFLIGGVVIWGLGGMSPTSAQCPQFSGNEAVSALPATLTTPHWFQCIPSVTATPTSFDFELTALPATHTGVQVDWGDGSPVEAIGNWNGTTPIPHTYSPTEWRTYTITVTTTACPGGAQGIVVYEPETPGAGLIYGDSNGGCAPFEGLPKIDINLAFSPTWSFTLDWGDGSTPDAFTMQDVFNDPQYDTLRFTSSGGDEIYRILGTSHTYSSGNCSMGDCDHTLTLTYSNYCSVRGATTPFVPGGSIVGTGFKQATLTDAFLTWDVDEAEIDVAQPVVCWPNNQTSVSNAACANCCSASSGNNVPGNGTVRTEKWDFGGATYVGGGPDPTNWLDWSDDCTSGLSHALSFPGPGVYTVTLYTQNHCGIDTATREIMVTPPPNVTATGDVTTLCPGEPFQFETVGWTADPPLTADDLSFNFSYGDGPFSITIAMVDGLIPFGNIPSQPGHVYGAAGTYDAAVQVFPTAAPACVGVAEVPVTVLTPPVADFSLPADACAEQASVQPVDASTDAVDYAWTLDGVGAIGADDAPAPVNLVGPGQFTFTLDVTSANGCTDSQSRTYTLADIPEADFAVADACLGVPTVLDGTASTTDAALGGDIVQYAWTLGDGTPLSGPTQILEYTDPGAQSVSLVVTTAAGCSDTLDGAFTILPRPGVQLLDGDTLGCSPLTLALDAIDTTGNVSTSGLIWDYGHGSATGPGPDGTHTWPPNNSEDTVYYAVTVEAGLGGCASSAALQVAVAPSPFVQTDGGEVCSGEAFAFEGNAFNLGDAPSWFWEVDEVWSTFAGDYGTITSDYDDFTYTFTNPGTVTDTVSISLSVFRPNGCAATDEATLLVRPSFAPFVEEEEGCSPLPVTAPAQVAISVDWDFGDPANPDPPGATGHLYTDPGVYTVVADGISVFGCAGSDTTTVTVHPTPTPSISVADVLCAPEPAQPMRSDSVDDGATSWSLQVDLGTTYPWNGSTDTTVALTPGTHLLTVLATSAEGCTAEASATVLVQNEVTADFFLPEDGCSPVEFEALGIDFPAAALPQWTVDTPFGTDTLTTATPSAPSWIADADTATYTVTLQVVDPLTGCSASHTESISVFPQPMGDLVVDGLNGCDVVATLSYTGAADTFTWQYGDPFAPEPETTSTGTISHAYPNPLGTGYIATATLTTAIGGCTDMDEVSFEIPAIVDANLDLPDTLCMGDVLVLDNLSTGVPLDLGTAFGAWTWTVGGDTLVGFEPLLPPTDTAIVDAGPQTNAILPVSLTIVHPESGCTDAISTDIVVLGLPAASFIATPDLLLEAPYTTNIVDLNQLPTGATESWTVTGEGAYDPDLGTVSWPDDAWGTHTITTTLDNFGCADSFSQDVLLIPPPPTVEFEGDTTSCAPLQASFTPTLTGVVDSLVWTFGNGTSRTVQDLVGDPIGYGYFDPGTFTVGVTAYGPGGNAVAETHTVIVLDQVNAGFSMFPSECVEVGDVIEFTPNLSYEDAIYTWDFGDGDTEVVPGGDIVTHTYDEAGSPLASLTIENALCIDSTQRTVCIIEFQGGSVGVPSAFTPTFGGDGSGAQAFADDDLRDNDIFFPQLRGNPIAYSFTVYNRWGEQIFHTADPGVGWNGHFQGKLCKQDVYVWRVAAVFLDGTSVEQAGDVTLIRR